MKAVAVRPEQKTVSIIETAVPSMNHADDVALKTLEVGVCGTDREICAFDYGTPPSGTQELVIGHECLAEVAAIGSGVSKLRVGDLVVPMVRRPCPHENCKACQNERQDFCYTGDFHERGIKEAHGFMSESFVEKERWLVSVPRELRDVAVLTEPLTIAEKALAQIRQVQQRLPWGCSIVPGKGRGHCHSAVVLGAGPVGLLGAMALAAEGFGVFVYSREADDSRQAEIVRGIQGTFISAMNTDFSGLAQRVGNIDVVFEATGASAASFELMKVLGKNGIFIFTGVPGRKGPISIDADFLMRNLVLNNQVFCGTVNADRPAFEAAICHLQVFIERWPEALRALITGRFEVESAIELLHGRKGSIKDVICFG